MSLINTGSARSARSYEPLAEEPKARELQIEERIADNVADFLDNHVLQLSLTDNESRGLDEEGMFQKQSLFNWFIRQGNSNTKLLPLISIRIALKLGQNLTRV